jgi:hypothetical protein
MPLGFVKTLLDPVRRGEADVVYRSHFAAGAIGNPRWNTLGNRLLTFACHGLTGFAPDT